MLAVVGCMLPGRLIVFTPARVEANHALYKYSRLAISSPLLCSPWLLCSPKADRSWQIREAVLSFFSGVFGSVSLGCLYLLRSCSVVVCGASSAILGLREITDLTYAVLCSNWENVLLAFTRAAYYW